MTAIPAVPNRVPALTPRLSLGLSWWKSLLLVLPMLLLSAVLVTQGKLPDDPLLMAALIVTWLGFNVSFFLMLLTGRTDRYRAPLFIVTALAMIVTFSTIILTERGSTALTFEDVINGRTPFCYMVTPMIILPALINGTIIFPGSLLEGFAPIVVMVVLVIGASLVMGRGFCSWMCFYGGYEDGCSRILKRPLIRKIDRRWTLFPFAMLIFVIITAAISLEPTYCTWFCPFKTVTEYAAVTDLLTLIQAVIFVGLFVGLVIVLPILTKKRTQCGLFCPFGAMQSLTNKVNVFDVRIDAQKCSGCKKCINTCPTFSLDENSMTSGRALITCTKCGKCVDACPKGAIRYHIKGTGAGSRPVLQRVLFLYPTFLLMVAFSAGSISYAIHRILLLITTGSML